MKSVGLGPWERIGGCYKPVELDQCAGYPDKLDH